MSYIIYAMNISDQIKEFLAEEGLSIEVFASKIGVSHTSIRNLIKQQTKSPSNYLLKKIAKYFNAKLIVRDGNYYLDKSVSDSVKINSNNVIAEQHADYTTIKPRTETKSPLTEKLFELIVNLGDKIPQSTRQKVLKNWDDCDADIKELLIEYLEKLANDA